MLLTLAVSSLRALLQAPVGGGGSLTALDVPAFAREKLNLHALNVPAWLLRGWTMNDLEKLRDVADKAACPCLFLVDDEPLDFGSANAATRAAASDRFQRLSAAAHRLGCNAVALAVKGPSAAAAKGAEDGFERTVAGLKAVIARVDRLELNVLLRPTAGYGDDPTKLTDLIKRVGGFRIGSLPDFGNANRNGHAEATLRKLAPYAGAIHATIEGFDAEGRHLGCDLSLCVHAIRSVGYQNTLAIEYVGKGDPEADIRKAREMLAAIISGDPGDADIDEIVADALGAVDETVADSADTSDDGETAVDEAEEEEKEA